MSSRGGEDGDFDSHLGGALKPPSPQLVTRRLTVGRRDGRRDQTAGTGSPDSGHHPRGDGPVKDGETSEEKKSRGMPRCQQLAFDIRVKLNN